MKHLRILISSPGDVEAERNWARRVVEGMNSRYAGQFVLEPVLWQSLPLSAGSSFQEGIDVSLSDADGIDVAIFVLWARIGSPLGPRILRKDGREYRSGAEREFDLMLRERRRSGGKRPHILVYRRQDEAGYHERLRPLTEEERTASSWQKQQVEKFFAEWFQDPETGSNTSAYHCFSDPIEFSKLLREHLQRHLDPLRGRWEGVPPWEIELKGPPFQGLESFQFEHEAVFFGREDEKVQVWSALRQQACDGCAFVLIWGASGSGKSSLARAGVLPLIVSRELDGVVKTWRHLAFTPAELGDNLFMAFAAKLTAEGVLPELCARGEPVSALAKSLQADAAGACLLNLLPALTAAGGGAAGAVRLVLLVDQLEELFAEGAALGEQREPFLAMLEALARSGQIWVLATLRSDFYAIAQESPSLVRMRRGRIGTVDLTPPAEDAILRMIRDPAHVAGLTWEQNDGRSLDAVIFRDSAADGERLPLLQYLLSKLFDARKNQVLTFAAYAKVGGVQGALRETAERVFEKELTEGGREEFAHVMRRVVTIDQEKSGASTRRWADYDELIKSPGAREFVLAFLSPSARLFVVKQGEASRREVSVAHESLLIAWPRLATWIADNRASLRARTAISGDARLWLEHGRDRSYLYLEGLQLKEATRLLTEGFLERDEQEFVSGSIAAAVEAKFRHSLETGEAMEEEWHGLGETHAAVRSAVLAESLRAPSTALRRNSTMLLSQLPPMPLSEQLVETLLFDPSDAVRREAANGVLRQATTEPFEGLLDRLNAGPESLTAVGALARLLASAEMYCQAPHFDEWYDKLPAELRRRLRVCSWRLRWKEALPVFAAVLFPSVLFAIAAASICKSVPGLFNWAYSQASAGMVMGMFHGTVAAVFIGGLSVFGLTLHRMVLGREFGVFTYLRPWGATVAGALFGGVGGLLCTLAITTVYDARSLRSMGWLDETNLTPSLWELCGELTFQNRCGLPFVLNGMGVGIGMALITNRLRKSAEWEGFLSVQSSRPLSDLGGLGETIRGLFRLARPFVWPLPVSLFITSSLALSLLLSAAEVRPWPAVSLHQKLFGGMAQAQKTAALPGQELTQSQRDEQSNEERAAAQSLREWKTSFYGRFSGIAGDWVAMVVGAFCAVVGMGLGIVFLRCGISMEPRKKIG